MGVGGGGQGVRVSTVVSVLEFIAQVLLGYISLVEDQLVEQVPHCVHGCHRFLECRWHEPIRWEGRYQRISSWRLMAK